MLSREGGPEDRRGTDGWAFGLFGEDRVQVKFDRTIARTGNIYHEVYEKTKGRPDQDWRPSPHQAKWYVFATEGYAWLVPTTVLAEVETGLPLTQITETSKGFLIREWALDRYQCERKEHNL